MVEDGYAEQLHVKAKGFGLGTQRHKIAIQVDHQHRRHHLTSKRAAGAFQAQAAHFRSLPDSGRIAVSHHSATKSADARRGAAVDGELRQAAGAVASAAADKRAVTGSQPQTLQCTICRERQKPKFIRGFALAPPASDRLLLVIQVPHASDKRGVALLSCPIDGFVLSFLKVARMPPPTGTASA